MSFIKFISKITNKNQIEKLNEIARARTHTRSFDIFFSFCIVTALLLLLMLFRLMFRYNFLDDSESDNYTWVDVI